MARELKGTLKDRLLWLLSMELLMLVLLVNLRSGTLELEHLATDGDNDSP